MRILIALAAVMLAHGLASPALAQGFGHRGLTDFALLDQEPTVADVSVQCGALKDRAPVGTAGPEDSPVAMIVHITMGNRDDPGIGGVDGFIRVTYTDTDFVDYPIGAGETLDMTLAAGGTLGVDDTIKVTSTGGAVLIGQISVWFMARTGFSPHPDLPAGGFCTTTEAP